MNQNQITLLGISVATLISIWFGVSILNPKLIGRAQYDYCIGGAIESGNLTPDLSKVCSHLK